MSTTSEHPEIELCGRTFPVVPQRIARLQAGIGQVIATAVAEGTELTPAAFMRFASTRLYEVFCTLIPGVDDIPEWRFAGYVDEQAFKDGEYDARTDQTSPTLPEIMEAFAVAIRVNRLNEVIGAMLDPKVVLVLKAELNALIVDSISSSFQNSPLASGGSVSMSSLESTATVTENSGSRSLASTA